MERLEVCPNCGHVFVIMESQIAKAGGRCPVCGRPGPPVSVGAEEYGSMSFENRPQGSGRLDSKTWVVLGAIFVAGIFTFLAGNWAERICGAVFMLALAAFYLIERAQLEKMWKKKG